MSQRYEDHLEGRLDEYVDGTLDVHERAAVAAHLEGCGACRDGLASLERLAADVAALPPAIAPPRDLWPAVAGRLESARSGRRGARRVGWVFGLAAAASLLLVVGGVHRAQLQQPRTGSPAEALAEVRAAEADYLRAAERLALTLEQHRASLPPELGRDIDDNLRVIDLAIEDARAAMARHPNDPRVAHVLNDMYREKVELLASAARLATRDQEG